MATLLEEYNQKKASIYDQVVRGSFPVDQLLAYQELLYRIDVLESCLAFVRTAPVTADSRILGYHYRVVDGFLTCVLQERQFGPHGDEKLNKQRQTAQSNLNTVIATFRKRFQCFAPTNQNAYAHEIQTMINTILPAWISYRNTYVAV